MDGAWALYEAWVLLQEGEIDAALVYSFGRSSLGDLHEILTLQLDPYYEAPLWPDIVSLSALQARALIDAGKATEADFAAVASRSRRDALANPQGPGAQGRGPPRRCCEDDYVVAPLRRHALPPITDGAAAIVLAAGDKAAAVVGAAGVDHRIRPPHGDPLAGRPRPHRRRRRRPWPPRWPASPPARSTSPSSTPPSPTRS